MKIIHHWPPFWAIFAPSTIGLVASVVLYIRVFSPSFTDSNLYFCMADGIAGGLIVGLIIGLAQNAESINRVKLAGNIGCFAVALAIGSQLLNVLHGGLICGLLGAFVPDLVNTIHAQLTASR